MPQPQGAGCQTFDQGSSLCESTEVNVADHTLARSSKEKHFFCLHTEPASYTALTLCITIIVLDCIGVQRLDSITSGGVPTSFSDFLIFKKENISTDCHLLIPCQEGSFTDCDWAQNCDRSRCKLVKTSNSALSIYHSSLSSFIISTMTRGPLRSLKGDSRLVQVKNSNKHFWAENTSEQWCGQ